MYERIQAMLTTERASKQRKVRRQMALSADELKFGQKYLDKKGRVRTPKVLKDWGTADVGLAYKYFRMK